MEKKRHSSIERGSRKGSMVASDQAGNEELRRTTADHGICSWSLSGLGYRRICSWSLSSLGYRQRRLMLLVLSSLFAAASAASRELGQVRSLPCSSTIKSIIPMSGRRHGWFESCSPHKLVGSRCSMLLLRGGGGQGSGGDPMGDWKEADSDLGENVRETGRAWQQYGEAGDFRAGARNGGAIADEEEEDRNYPEGMKVCDALQDMGVLPREGPPRGKRHDDPHAPEMARHFGVTDDMMMQEGADKSLLYDWMYYGTKYGSNGGLGGHGWADFEVHRFYWGLRYVGADLQLLQQLLFVNRTRAELKSKLRIETRRRPWLVEHALSNRLEIMANEGVNLAEMSGQEPSAELQGTGWEFVNGIIRASGNINSRDHPLNKRPPISYEYVRESLEKAKTGMMAGVDSDDSQQNEGQVDGLAQEIVEGDGEEENLEDDEDSGLYEDLSSTGFDPIEEEQGGLASLHIDKPWRTEKSRDPEVEHITAVQHNVEHQGVGMPMAKGGANVGHVGEEGEWKIAGAERKGRKLVQKRTRVDGEWHSEPDDQLQVKSDSKDIVAAKSKTRNVSLAMEGVQNSQDKLLTREGGQDMLLDRRSSSLSAHDEDGDGTRTGTRSASRRREGVTRMRSSSKQHEFSVTHQLPSEPIPSSTVNQSTVNHQISQSKLPRTPSPEEESPVYPQARGRSASQGRSGGSMAVQRLRKLAAERQAQAHDTASMLGI